MLINLLGPQIIIHPYADRGRDIFSVLTYDTRSKDTTFTELHDGLVYEEQHDRPGGPLGSRSHRHALMDDFYIVEDGILRTVVPLLQGQRVFSCGHIWQDETRKDDPLELNARKRIATLKTQDGMLVVQHATTLITVDLSLELELDDPNKQTLWDHLKL
jgi:hypothetical protein